MVILTTKNQLYHKTWSGYKPDCGSRSSNVFYSQYSNLRTGIYCLPEQETIWTHIFTTVGMNPKEYARIVRFQKSLKLMQNQTENISQTQIAYQCGYSDQSHFIREFRELSRYTPLSLIKYASHIPIYLLLQYNVSFILSVIKGLFYFCALI